jgi:glycosyltransferase involved in cell wall biosynthesis
VQDHNDYEIIVVDDGSTDDTVAVLESYADKRLRIVKHSENRGVCAARNTGTKHSSGRWIVSVDCDWAILPGCLKLMADKLNQTPDEAKLVYFSVRCDKTGEIWPDLPAPEGIFGFEEYIKWVESNNCSACVWCRRKEIFDVVQWPTDRRLEFQFHLQAADSFKSFVHPDVVGVVYEDAPYAISSDMSYDGIKRRMATSPDQALAYREILQVFGFDIKQHTPRLYQGILWASAYCHFQAGQRLYGLRYALLALLRKPWAVELYFMVILGLLGPSFMAQAKRLKFARSIFLYLHNRNKHSGKKNER